LQKGGGARTIWAGCRCSPAGEVRRAAAGWHVRSVYDSKNVDLRESLAVLALLTAIPANALAAAALAELLARRRSCERIAEALVRWTREA
jgi:hypothetical protein